VRVSDDVLVVSPRQMREWNLSTCLYLEWRAKAACHVHSLAGVHAEKAHSLVTVGMRPMAVSMEANVARGEGNNANVSYIQSFDN
jgi:hypothetical protein